MSRRQNPRDPSGFIFDVQSNTVMAQGGAFENMKEKISAVRAIVPNRSNNEIVLVLQHFDNCVDRTVQAFMEGNASEVLKEWTVTGKRKNKKKKPKAKAPSDPGAGGLPGGPAAAPLAQERPAKAGLNGFHCNGCSPGSGGSLSEGLDGLCPELEDGDPPAAPQGAAAVPALANGLAGSDPTPLTLQPPRSPPAPRQQRPEGPPRPPTPGGSAPPPLPAAAAAARLHEGSLCPASRKLGPSLERSLKDLQRCAVSLARYRALLREEVEASLRRVKVAFGELQGSLMDREVALLAEMDGVKAEAMAMLQGRQRRAEALRKQAEAAARLPEEQLLELRADIKHFVTERKFDEELGRCGRFSCDLEGLRGSIGAFGQVSHPKNSYSSRPRCPPATTPSPPAAAPGPSGPPAATKKPSASSSSSSSSGGSRPPPPGPEAPQGSSSSRRPGGGGGPRAQGQRPPRPPGRPNRQRPPAPPASGPRPPTAPPGLPQRKPRPGRQGGGASS